MEDNENLVTEGNEEVSENVEQTTEETPKIYSEEELNSKVNEITGRRIARKEAKIRREFDTKYRDLEEVLRAGTGQKFENVEEMTDYLKHFYEGNGVKIPEKASLSDSENAILAKAEAEDIISSGYDEVVGEVERLAALGAAKMTAREREVFKTLAEYRKSADEARELSSLGVPSEVYESDEFKSFAKKFAQTTPIRDVYEIYRQTQPKKEHKTAGSMKQTPAEDNGVRDYYSFEEASRFTRDDLDKNPALYEAIVKSMPKWK